MTHLNFGVLNCSCMLLEVAGFQGCYRGKHCNNWLITGCARAVRACPLGFNETLFYKFSISFVSMQVCQGLAGYFVG